MTQTQEKLSILLVDDDPMVIRILNRILLEFAPLRFATSGPAALKLAREAPPDLVLLDVEMPGMSGFEVCQAFKSEPALASVPIILISSHESPQLLAKGLELGATDFISKPPHASLVLARVRTYQRMKVLSDTVRSAVTMDFLTGALTRRQFEKTLLNEWMRAQRSAAPLVLLLAHIDGFAELNAEHGEERGDACLKAVADALRRAAQRPPDVLGRWAGGKFALLLPETDLAGARTIAQRALDGVGGLNIPGVTLSVGGCTREDARAGAEELMAAAEQALKSARSRGGHQCRFSQ